MERVEVRVVVTVRRERMAPLVGAGNEPYEILEEIYEMRQIAQRMDRVARKAVVVAS